MLRGKDFVAERRLSTKDNTTLAEVGQTCERVPAASLHALLTSGKIRPLTDEERAMRQTGEEV